MNNRATWFLAALVLIALIIGGIIGLWISQSDTGDQTAKTVTVEETVREQPINNNKTVPLKETHTENNHYYTQPCKLPNTGP